ncbi:hypothetical protein GUJ93_ZPchr0009g1380 [Zizania palustris]|uniref:Uncharacterized protein n=1 Tax=Zizania palustris TaxID=103762 RepID=A0A8J5R452_ZIZPA|nr:hypothetical protein GUJ93_ZPchr0009g1380 [Zizania palustris]
MGKTKEQNRASAIYRSEEDGWKLRATVGGDGAWCGLEQGAVHGCRPGWRVIAGHGLMVLLTTNPQASDSGFE